MSTITLQVSSRTLKERIYIYIIGQMGDVVGETLISTIVFYIFFSLYHGVASQSYNKDALKCGHKGGVAADTPFSYTFFKL